MARRSRKAGPPRCSGIRGGSKPTSAAGAGRRAPASPVAPMLEITDLHVYYGEIHALKGISFRVAQGEIVTLLGNNGAGKTTTLRTLSGLLSPRQGDVRFEGTSLVGIPPHDVVLKGITHVPEGRRIFNRLTVVENLEMGAYTRGDPQIATDMEHVFTTFPRLKERRTQGAGTPSGGAQQTAGPGAGLGWAPAAAPAERALHGTGAGAGRADLRDGADHQPSGRHHTAGRAERGDGPVHRGAGLRARDGPVAARGPGSRPGRQSGSAPRLSG